MRPIGKDTQQALMAVRVWFRRQTRPGRPLAVIAAILLAGAAAVFVRAATSQQHAPQPTAAVAGTIGRVTDRAALSTAPRGSATADWAGRSTTASQPRDVPPPVVQGPVLPTSPPMWIAIPAIGVKSSVRALGINSDGTLEVPQAGPLYNDAAWYKYSPTPGQLGPSVIEGHVDSAAAGESVFYRLGALKPGDEVDVTLADRTVAVFTVSAVRQYAKTAFPTAIVYGRTNFAALRLVTCGGIFDLAAHSYRSNTVVFASLTSSHPTA